MSVALLYLAVFAGGLLAILSPCILPVLPFVFTRSGKPFRAETLPLLAGLVWVRWRAAAGGTAALVLRGIAGGRLLSSQLGNRLTRPIVRLGARLEAGASSGVAHDGLDDTTAIARPGRALILGVATGLLWAPCAGPILGLVAAGAAAGARPEIAASLFATFVAGAAVALAGGVVAGGAALRILRRVAGSTADVWVRRGLGVAAVGTAFVVALGWDARLFAGRGVAQTASAEEVVLNRLVPDRHATITGLVSHPHGQAPIPTPDEGPLPSFDGATGWLNTGGGDHPLSADALRG